jgi:hypothetical protein
MLTPQQPVGEQAAAKVQILTAQKVLVQAMQAFDPGSSEFKGLMSAIKALTGAFGKDEEKQEELQPADVKNLLQTIAGPGQGGPPPGGPPGGPPAPPGPPG